MTVTSFNNACDLRRLHLENARAGDTFYNSHLFSKKNKLYTTCKGFRNKFGLWLLINYSKILKINISFDSQTLSVDLFYSSCCHF